METKSGHTRGLDKYYNSMQYFNMDYISGTLISYFNYYFQ